MKVLVRSLKTRRCKFLFLVSCLKIVMEVENLASEKVGCG